MYKDTKEYDSSTCITAAELRASGVPVPDEIPDVGWIPKSSMHFEQPVGIADDDGTIIFKCGVRFSEPFRWVRVCLDLPDPTEKV